MVWCNVPRLYLLREWDDLDSCRAGVLTQAAKDRALHRLEPVRLHLNCVIHPAMPCRELPETDQGECIKAPENTALVEPCNPVEFVNSETQVSEPS